MIKQIAATELREGMFVHKLGGSWLDHPFWRASFLVEDQDSLRRIQESGVLEVWIDTKRGLDLETPAQVEDIPPEIEQEMAEEPATSAPPEQVSMEQEVLRAARVLSCSMTAVEDLFQEARMGHALRMDSVRQVVDDIANSVQRNPGVLIALARLRRKDQYTYMHSISVGALMVALGRQLGLADPALREAGMAGLLHDIGKVHIQDSLLNKPGRLDDGEFDILRRHAHLGYETLRENSGAESIALDVCRHHHERYDGSGYPDGIRGKDISLYSRMAAVCDVYDATTSNRPYKVAWQAAYALRKMAEWRDSHFDPDVFHAFVKTVGIYPIGTLVRLKSEHLAVVLDQSQGSLLAPRIKVFFSIRGNRRVASWLIDLSAESTDGIIGAEDPISWGITDLESLWTGSNKGLV